MMVIEVLICLLIFVYIYLGVFVCLLLEYKDIVVVIEVGDIEYVCYFMVDYFDYVCVDFDLNELLLRSWFLEVLGVFGNVGVKLCVFRK